MARKRRNTSSPEPDDDLQPPKWRAGRDLELNHDSSVDGLQTPELLRRGPHLELNYDSEDDESSETPYVDERSGQSGAFPGLGGNGDELFYGPANDGIDYLRMVRSEAKGVPFILTAPIASAPPVELEDGEEVEDGGYYSDGAYTAMNHTTVAESPSLPLAQIRYYDSLITQFKLLQASLRCSPPLSAVETLRPDQFVSFPENNHTVRARWAQHMLSTDPHPVQLACMDAHTIVGLVQFFRMSLEEMLCTKDEVTVARIGAWVWAVLGKCQDRGELISEEIGDLRDLAKLALHLQQAHYEKSLKIEKERGSEDEAAQHDEPRMMDTAGLLPTTEQLEQLDTSLQNLLSITFDTIVTIIGEVYGQRDLLDLRTKWPKEKVG